MLVFKVNELSPEWVEYSRRWVDVVVTVATSPLDDCYRRSDYSACMPLGNGERE